MKENSSLMVKTTLYFYKDQRDEVAKLLALLHALHIPFSQKIVKESSQYANYEKTIISFEYDYMQFKMLNQHNPRNSGRIKKELPRKYSLSEFEEDKKTKNVHEIAESLNISVATLYRKINEAKKYNKENLNIGGYWGTAEARRERREAAENEEYEKIKRSY